MPFIGDAFNPNSIKIYEMVENEFKDSRVEILMVIPDNVTFNAFMAVCFSSSSFRISFNISERLRSSDLPVISFIIGSS